MAEIGSARFEIIGDLVVILRQTTEHHFQIVLPCQPGQTPNMIRLLVIVGCAVHIF